MADTEKITAVETPSPLTVNIFCPDHSVVTQNVSPLINDNFKRYAVNSNNGTEITGDRFDEPNKSVVVVASTGAVIHGSFRIVIGANRPDIQPPIDAMILMKYPYWEVEATAKPIGEFSRFMVNPSLSRIEQLTVLRTLYIQASDFAQRHNFADHIFVILAHHVLKFVEDSGIEVELCPEAVLNEENPEARQVFDEFPGYWRKYDPPKLYRFIPFLRQ